MSALEWMMLFIIALLTMRFWIPLLIVPLVTAVLLIWFAVDGASKHLLLMPQKHR